MLRENQTDMTAGAPYPQQRTDPRAAAMTARAALSCENVDGAVNRLTRLRSEGQFVLRPTQPKGFEPWTHGTADAGRVSVSSGTAGPLGGDRLSLDVFVGPGAVLVLNEISATLALPGTSGEQSIMDFTVRVEDGATLIWLPEPVIAARNCDHRQNIRVSLAVSARFLLREELIVGRHNEVPGNIQQQVRVRRDGQPIHDQNLRLGQRYQGWDGPSVADRNKAVGNMLIVDPASGIGNNRADLIDAQTISVGLDEDVVQASAVAADSLALSHALDEVIDRLGPPWSS